MAGRGLPPSGTLGYVGTRLGLIYGFGRLTCSILYLRSLGDRVTEQHQESLYDSGGAPDTPPVDLGKWANSLVKAVSKGMEDEVSAYELTPLEFMLLRSCVEREECTATDLAEDLPVDASRISRLVTSLVDKGLLMRHRIRDDRRVVMLRVSNRGNELTSLLMERIQAYDAMLMRDISAEEMAVFTSVTSKIVANYSALYQPD